MGRRNNSLSYAPITVLVLFMGLLYGVFMLTLVPPLSGGTEYPVDPYYPNSDAVSLGVVNFLFLLTLTCFLRASFTAPGGIPSARVYDPDVTAGGEATLEVERALAAQGLFKVRGVERKSDGRARFCRICGRYKPDRAHHSSNHGTCVLEMDHYCPWIRNCVGHFNKKYFFLLVIYGAMSLVGFAVAMGPRFAYTCRHMRPTALELFIVLTFVLALLMALATTVFGIFHVFLMSKAYTTIEFCEKRRAADAKRTHFGFKVKDLYETSPYDQGCIRNMSHVLGPWYLWLVPTRRGMPAGPSAGCVFPIDHAHPLYRSLADKMPNPNAEPHSASDDPASQSLLATEEDLLHHD